MIVVVCALAIAATSMNEPATEVPLVLPKIKRKGVEPEPASLPASTPMVIQRVEPPKPPPPWPLNGLFHLGLKGAGFVGTGRLRGGGGGAIEIGVRLPFAGRRLGLMLEPMFAAVLGDAAPSISGWWLAIPLGVTYHEKIGVALLRISASAALDIVATTTVLPGGPGEDLHFTIGAMGGIGFVFPAGPGGIVLEVRYRLLAYVAVGEQIIAHGGTANLGYSFFF